MVRAEEGQGRSEDAQMHRQTARKRPMAAAVPPIPASPPGSNPTPLPPPLQVLDWFTARNLSAYSISCGQSLLYNNIFPKHKERLGKKMSELVGSVAKVEIPAWRKHFDVVVACEDEEGEDIDVPLISIKFR